MNQILTFQLDRISLNAGVPENSGIFRNASISEDFEVHGVLQFSLSNLPAQARANLSAILAEKQNLINKAITDQESKRTWDVYDPQIFSVGFHGI